MNSTATSAFPFPFPFPFSSCSCSSSSFVWRDEFMLIICSFCFGMLFNNMIITTKFIASLWFQVRMYISTTTTTTTTTATITRKKGMVVLVGAGPGDPELLTFGGVNALKNADVVITDLLVCNEILERFCKSDALILYANKVKGNAHAAQKELNEWMVEHALQGKNVVRLKGGDPFLYGRGVEEIDYLHQNGLEAFVIPGISSSLAGPIACGISVTSRGVADQFLVATAHGKNDRIPEVPNYFPSRTVVFLMSVSRLEDLCKRLIELGSFPIHTPVRIIENATNISCQRYVSGTLETISKIANEQEHIKSPAVIIIGKAAGEYNRWKVDWAGQGMARYRGVHE